MKMRLLLLFPMVLFVAGCGAADPMSEPGPAVGGLRLGLLVTPRIQGAREQHQVRVEVTNVSHETVVLRAQQWRSLSREGGFLEFLEATVSVESDPPIEPWLGQVMRGLRSDFPEPEHALKAGESLSVTWTTTGRFLKNKVSDPLEVQNPEFRENGLYSVHAHLVLTAGGKTVQLRSNEQLVSFGGSRESPKHTYGPLLWTDEPSRTATLGLGSIDQIATGDRFRIQSGYIGRTWTLSITNVEERSSSGTLEPSRVDPPPAFPERGSHAALVQ